MNNSKVRCKCGATHSKIEKGNAEYSDQSPPNEMPEGSVYKCTCHERTAPEKACRCSGVTCRCYGESCGICHVKQEAQEIEAALSEALEELQGAIGLLEEKIDMTHDAVCDVEESLESQSSKMIDLEKKMEDTDCSPTRCPAGGDNLRSTYSLLPPPISPPRPPRLSPPPPPTFPHSPPRPPPLPLPCLPPPCPLLLSPPPCSYPSCPYHYSHCHSPSFTYPPYQYPLVFPSCPPPVALYQTPLPCTAPPLYPTSPCYPAPTCYPAPPCYPSPPCYPAPPPCPAQPHAAPPPPCPADPPRPRHSVPIQTQAPRAPSCCLRTPASNYIAGKRLLEASLEGRSDDVVSLLQDGVDVNFTHKSRWTPLHRAAWGCHADVVCILLCWGADANAQTAYGFTALHMAAHNDSSGECVRLLVEAGAELEARNDLLWTPLHYAAQSDNSAAVQELLQAGADRSARTDEGRLPHELTKCAFVRSVLAPDSVS